MEGRCIDPEKIILSIIQESLIIPLESRVKTKEDLDTLGIKTFFCSNVCSAYRRSEYDAMGGFGA